MSNIQFHFNPLTPVPSGGGKFPWKPALIGLGLFALFVAFAYAISKSEQEEVAFISDDESPPDKIP